MAVSLIDKFKPLEPWFERHRRDCWLPRVEDGDGNPKGSKFSGSAWLLPDEPWPACAICGNPMALFLQLDLAAAPHPLHPSLTSGLLQTFFCIDMDCVHGPDEGDPFAKNHLLRVVDSGRQGGRSERAPAGSDAASEIPSRVIIGWERADDYPSLAEARLECGLEHDHTGVVTCDDPLFSVKAKSKEFYAMPWARNGEKFAGWPGWANITVDYPNCPECGRRMDLMIFQFGHEGFIPVMFGDGGQGQLVCCPDHARVLAYPWTCG